MTIVETSAPGKAVIAGEYAVLAGAPAICMALNRRARVVIREVAKSSHCISAPGYLDGRFRFSGSPDQGVVWLDDLPCADSFALFELVWKQSGIARQNGLSITLDTAEFFDAKSGSKLGLGSSAALATALAAALTGVQSCSTSFEALAASAHREFQQGRGSGLDIATAIHGGVIEFEAGVLAASSPWPKGLLYRLLWSGKAVSTARTLEHLAQKTLQPSHDRLVALSRDVSMAWKAGNNAHLLAEMRRYTQVLQAFSVDHELGIFEAGHQELADKAKAHPKTVYKPCGAGGGDIGIVLAESMRDIDRFTADAVASGFAPLDILLDADGVQIKGGPPC